MLIDCKCGATNRIPGLSAIKHCCGKCKHIFTPLELTKARQEPAPPRPDHSSLFAGIDDDREELFDIFGLEEQEEPDDE